MSMRLHQMGEQPFRSPQALGTADCGAVDVVANGEEEKKIGIGRDCRGISWVESEDMKRDSRGRER